jgi:RNA polymerase sigma-70 factor, ECF subfamily
MLAAASQTRFLDVFEVSRHRVLAICRRITNDSKDAEDASQEVFLAIWRQLPQVRAVVGLTGWVGQIAVRTSYRSKKRRLRDAEMRDEIGMNASSAERVGLEQQISFAQALSLLPAGQREVFRLFVMEGFSQAEVARMLEIPEGTVASRLHLAKRRLMRALAA